MSLFKGEITADAVTARVSAGTGPSGAGGNTNGTTVVNLRVEGQPVTGAKVPVGDWGELTVDRLGGRHELPGRDEGLQDHGHRARPSPDRRPRRTARRQRDPDRHRERRRPDGAAGDDHDHDADRHHLHEHPTKGPSVGDSPSLRPRSGGKTKPQPLKVQPKLTAGRYVFPVYGPTSYIDTFGAKRADVTYHHGDDIFGSLGQPLVACTDGIVFSVGFNKIGGNRLWIVDKAGNQFYYAHLSAFALNAVNGAHVKAGQVIGFMGDTGDAEGTPFHLHFEIHPVSFLYLGYDGAVDPTPYLNAWQHQQDLPFPIAGGWVPPIGGFGSAAPEPGAILLGMHDISTADGLDPGSLERALAPVDRSSLMQTLVPTAVAPTGDLGKA